VRQQNVREGSPARITGGASESVRAALRYPQVTLSSRMLFWEALYAVYHAAREDPKITFVRMSPPFIRALRSGGRGPGHAQIESALPV